MLTHQRKDRQMFAVKARKNAPTKTTSHSDAMSFVVWSRDTAYAEDPLPWKVAAAFRFLQEALDYIAYCQDRGSTVVFQSPASVRSYGPDDTRAVFKAAA